MRDDDLSGRLGELIRHGTIASVDLAAGTITVRVGEIETQPIRFLTGGAGGTRVWSRPRVGEQVTLLAPEGDVEGAVALRGFPSASNPALCDPERELVQFEDGAAIGYDPAAGRMQIVLPAGATVSIVAPGGVTIDADVRITGDLLVDGKADVTGDVVGAGINLPHHRHSGVQAGSAVSGEPQS